VHIGVHIAQHGRLADPAVVRASALAAEELGYRSVWVHEPPASDLDPLLTLSFAAAATSRIRLGTSVLVAPCYRPAALARSLATLDVLSDHRLVAGLGAATLDLDSRVLDDCLDALDGAWDAGARRPPVLLDGAGPGYLDRVARRADGWTPAGVPVADLAPGWEAVRARAAEAGRDPEALSVVVRADVVVTDRPAGAGRASYEGDLDQVVADLDATRRAGAHEVLLAVGGDHDLDQRLALFATLAEALG
jgi:alkanesulfonate monooxygenase SsuD/methylene tetrahydromethanopterin reductase-like flavin-dependent oxidoreductase (luciferase family)